MIVKKVMNNFDQLTTKADKLKWVNEQILICYLGLGQTYSHHPWSKNEYHSTSTQLLDYLVEKIIPLKKLEISPIKPPIKLPTLPSDYELGTKSKGCSALENNSLVEEERSQLNAMTEREREREIGDEWIWK